MRKMLLTFAAFGLLVLGVAPGFAQTGSLEMTGRPIGELFDAIERTTTWRVFAPADPLLDSMRVTVPAAAVQMPPNMVVRGALEGTQFQVTTFENSIFVLAGRSLVTFLPPWHYSEGAATQVPDTLSSSFALAAADEAGAASQVRLYEVGDPAAKPQGRVSLSGYVYDSATGEPVTGIRLQVDDTNTYAISDAYGYYRFSLAPGRYDINISGFGQADSRRQVQLHSEGTLDILTAEKVNTMVEITVWGDRRDNVRQAAIGVERLTFSDIKNMPMAFGELDILKVVAALPGVKSAGEISSGFNVRGGATDQNLILYNDGTIFNPTHLFGLFSAFNPDVVRDMELYKSSIPTRFGGRISSVLDIHSREGNKKEFAGSASLGLLTSRLTLEGPLWRDRTSLIVGGRTTYSDWILRQLPEQSGYKNGNAGFWDVNASLSHRFDNRNNLYVDGYYSQDRFNFEAFEEYKYRNMNGSVKWRHLINANSWAVVSAGYDHYDHITRNTENEMAAYDMSFGIDQMFAKLDFTIQAGDRHSIGFGLGAQYYDLMPGEHLPYGEGSLIVPDTMPDEKAAEGALYVSDRWTISDRVEVDYGLRWSAFGALGPRDYTLYDPNYLPSPGTVTETGHKKGLLKTYNGPEFRFSARYSIMDDLSIKVGVGSMRQYIHKISNNTVMSPTDTWKLSDPNIAPQRGIQYAAGLYKDFRDRFVEITLEGYYKTLEDYLDYRSGARLLMNPHLERDLVATSGRAYGVELMVRRTEGRLNGWASYTWSRTELRQDDPRIQLPVNGGAWYPADFDKPHEVKVVANYRFTHRLSISVNADYSTGRPITLPIAKYSYAGGEYLYYSERNRFRVPDYFRLDASINIEPSHNLTLLTHSMITLGVYNATGRKNAHSVYFKQEAGRVNGYKLSIFGVPIPYISYNIKF
ncbi:MAG: TonB-dependent receptor [Alistipes sp.]|jgi:hypothetical protein|nr:TonB-dependent receptor [Alistipes sp.]